MENEASTGKDKIELVIENAVSNILKKKGSDSPKTLEGTIREALKDEIDAALLSAELREGIRLAITENLRNRINDVITSLDLALDDLSQRIADFPLSVRLLNCLDVARIETLKDLVSKTEDDLCDIRNFGEGALNEVKEFLEERGLKLAASSHTKA